LQGCAGGQFPLDPQQAIIVVNAAIPVLIGEENPASGPAGGVVAVFAVVADAKGDRRAGVDRGRAHKSEVTDQAVDLGGSGVALNDSADAGTQRPASTSAIPSPVNMLTSQVPLCRSAKTLAVIAWKLRCVQ
jgi:hypothetical protein